MNYAETIHFLFTRLPMFTRIGEKAYKKDLHNIRALEQTNGDPHAKLKTLHIAGTNGKGSTSHMLAAILQAAGYKTGLYTSPHLRDFRERIKINGKPIPEEWVVSFTASMLEKIQEIEPSFFEITVAMAFKWFQEENTAIAVVETGLGGRLDSTNIIRPEISVITNIGFDHLHILGDTLEKIAAEKAGIIKEHTPVVISESLPQTRPVFEAVAAEKQAPLYYAGNLQQVVDLKNSGHHLQVTIQEKGRQDAHQYALDLTGFYQSKNLPGVLQTIRLLNEKGWNIPDSAIQEGLANTRHLTGLHGRWEQIAHSPAIILDVGHNADGIGAIVNQLELTSYHHLHIVIGMVKDKDIEKVLSLLPGAASYYFTQAHIPRALPAEELCRKAKTAGLAGKSYEDVNLALDAAKSAAGKQDLILVCGSVFVVGEVNY